MTPERIQEIEQRLNAATPGPWEWWRDPSLVEDGVHGPQHPEAEYKDGVLVDAVTVCRGMTGPNREANAQFLASAPEDIRWLLSALKESHAAHAYAETALEAYRQGRARLVEIMGHGAEFIPDETLEAEVAELRGVVTDIVAAGYGDMNLLERARAALGEAP